MSNCL